MKQKVREAITTIKYNRELRRYEKYLRYNVKHFWETPEEAVRSHRMKVMDLNEKYFGEK